MLKVQLYKSFKYYRSCCRGILRHLSESAEARTNSESTNMLLSNADLSSANSQFLPEASVKRKCVLGIETSCDDTGAAVVDDQGNVLGESLNSQMLLHLELGGIQPPVARDLHRKNINDVVDEALRNANMTLQDVDAIATTVKPGLFMPLKVGLEYGKKLVEISRKPFIPINHMEAHALTVRMLERIEFPFLVLLISGGHCLLALARGVDDFLLFGQSHDDSPGDAFDKTARRLKLKNLPECAAMSGGQAIEHLASRGDPKSRRLVPVMTKIANCNFSFAGLKARWQRNIEIQEERLDIRGGSVLPMPDLADICATFQYAVLHHLAKRVQRAMLFCHMKATSSWTEPKTLVVSGGVASNMFIRRGLERMCEHYDYRLLCPPPKLCTDNGVMIAWNGMEKLLAGRGIVEDPSHVVAEPKCQFGVDMIADVAKCSIRLERIDLLD